MRDARLEPSCKDIVKCFPDEMKFVVRIIKFIVNHDVLYTRLWPVRKK